MQDGSSIPTSHRLFSQQFDHLNKTEDPLANFSRNSREESSEAASRVGLESLAYLPSVRTSHTLFSQQFDNLTAEDSRAKFSRSLLEELSETTSYAGLESLTYSQSIADGLHIKIFKKLREPDFDYGDSLNVEQALGPWLDVEIGIESEARSIRLNKAITLMRYKRIFERQSPGFKSHITVRLRGMVETMIQVTKIGFHRTATAIDKLIRKNDKVELHNERLDVHLRALHLVSAIVRHPRVTLQDKVDEAVVEFFKQEHI